MARLTRNNDEQTNKKKSFLLYILVGLNLVLTLYLYYKLGI